MCDHQTYCMYLANLVRFFFLLLSFFLYIIIYISIFFAFESRSNPKLLQTHARTLANVISFGWFYRTFYLAISQFCIDLIEAEKLFDDFIMFGQYFFFYFIHIFLFVFSTMLDQRDVHRFNSYNREKISLKLILWNMASDNNQKKSWKANLQIFYGNER